MQHVDPSVGWDDPDYTRPPAGDGVRPGRWLAVAYVAVTIGFAVLYLWSISVPGVRYLAWMASLWAFAVIALIWLVAAAVTLVRLARGRLSPGTVRREGWYLVAVPLIGLLLVVARVTEAPLRLRFEPARAEFTEFAENALADAQAVVEGGRGVVPGSAADWDAVRPQVPLSIGGFRVRSARVVPEGVLIFDTQGAFLDDAGFAYLPKGEFPGGDGSLGSPDFRSLGGDWYAFTASW